MGSGGFEESHGVQHSVTGTLERLFEVLEKQSQQIENVLQNQTEMKVLISRMM